MVLRLKGGRTIRAGRETVWAALHDVSCLKLSVPGCLSLQRTSETRYDISVLVPLGFVSVAFSGHVETTASDRPNRLRLSARGTGGLAGFVAGTADLELTEQGDGCHLAYVVEAAPPNALAGAGMLLLSRLAHPLIGQFGTTFAALVADQASGSGLAPALRLAGHEWDEGWRERQRRRA